VDVFADSLAITIVVRTAIVPSVLRAGSLGKSLATLVAEKLPFGAVVPVKVEFQLGPEGTLTVPAGMGHVLNIHHPVLKLQRNVHVGEFRNQDTRSNLPNEGGNYCFVVCGLLFYRRGSPGTDLRKGPTDNKGMAEDVRVWLVERTYSDDEQNLIILTYATPDGSRSFRKERALTSFSGEARGTNVALDVSPDDLSQETDPEIRSRYADEAQRMASEHDPNDTL